MESNRRATDQNNNNANANTSVTTTSNSSTNSSNYNNNNNNNNNSNTRTHAPIDVCPLGISALELINDINVQDEVLKYKAALKQFLLIIQLQQEKKSAIELMKERTQKIDALIFSLKSLAEMEVIAGRIGKNVAVDVLQEIKSLYLVIAKNFTEKDVITLNQAIEDEFKQNKESEKWKNLRIIKKLITKEELHKQSNPNYHAVNIKLEHLFTPEMLRDAAHEINGNCKCQNDKKLATSEQQRDEKFLKALKALEVEITKLDSKLKALEDEIAKKDQKIESKQKKHDEKLAKGKKDKKGDNRLEEIKKERRERAKCLDEARKERCELAVLASNLQHLQDLLNVTTRAIPERAKRSSGNLSMYSEVKELDLDAVEEKFDVCERGIKHSIETIKNPYFKKYLKDLEPIFYDLISDFQKKRYAFFTDRFQYANDVLNYFKEKLKCQQKIYEMTSDILSKLAICIEENGITKYHVEDLSTANGEAAEKFIQEKLGKKYIVESLGAAGNNPVHLITDRESKLKVVLRVSCMPPSKLEDTSSADHLRYRLSSSLNLSIVPVTLQYALVPGISQGDGSDYRNIEISAAVTGGKLKDLFDELHKNLQAEMDDKNSTGDFQMYLIFYIRELLRFLLRLEDIQYFYPDLKPGNLLLDETGKVRVSDVKTLLNVANVADLNRFCPKEPLTDLSPAYIIEADCINLDAKPIKYDLKRVQLDSLVFTLYELLTNKIDLEENAEEKSETKVKSKPKKTIEQLKQDKLKMLTNILKDINPIFLNGKKGNYIVQVFQGLIDILLKSANTKTVVNPQELREEFTKLLKKLEKSSLQLQEFMRVMNSIPSQSIDASKNDNTPTNTMEP